MSVHWYTCDVITFFLIPFVCIYLLSTIHDVETCTPKHHQTKRNTFKTKPRKTKKKHKIKYLKKETFGRCRHTFSVDFHSVCLYTFFSCSHFSISLCSYLLLLLLLLNPVKSILALNVQHNKYCRRQCTTTVVRILHSD